MYVSKHCDTWRTLAIGHLLNLDVVTYRRTEYNGGKTYKEIKTGGSAMCPLE